MNAYDPATIVMCEPSAKDELFDKLKSALIECGWEDRSYSNRLTDCCHTLLPSVRRKKLQLNQMTNLLKKWSPLLVANPDLSLYGKNLLIQNERKDMFSGTVISNPWPVFSWNDNITYRERIAILQKGEICSCSLNDARRSRHVFAFPLEAPYVIGQMIYHHEHGQGVVISCQSSDGDYIITAAFAGKQGAQRFMLSAVHTLG